jgi:hypothetical protein
MMREQRFIAGLSAGVSVGLLIVGAVARDPGALFLAILAAACCDAWRPPPP